MTLNNKFDPSWKESPDLPGELEDTLICDRCHKITPVSEMETGQDDSMFCAPCAAELEVMWELAVELQEEDQNDQDE